MGEHRATRLMRMHCSLLACHCGMSSKTHQTQCDSGQCSGSCRGRLLSKNELRLGGCIAFPVRQLTSRMYHMRVSGDTLV